MLSDLMKILAKSQAWGILKKNDLFHSTNKYYGRKNGGDGRDALGRAGNIFKKT
jgi:hypothetical protein